MFARSKSCTCPKCGIVSTHRHGTYERKLQDFPILGKFTWLFVHAYEYQCDNPDCDITCIHVLKEGWTYLAAVMDLGSRKIIGYAYGMSMTAELAVEAVKNVCLNVRNTRGIILHSDLGSQYTSQAFENCLSSRKMLHSFSRKRIHSAIGYLTPRQKEDEELKKAA